MHLSAVEQRCTEWGRSGLSVVDRMLLGVQQVFLLRHYLWITGEKEKALSVVLQSVQTFPRNVSFRTFFIAKEQRLSLHLVGA